MPKYCNIDQMITDFKLMAKYQPEWKQNTILGMCETMRFAKAANVEPVCHEGDTTFITTETIGSYANRIIVKQGNQCRVYYADEVHCGYWVHLGGDEWCCSQCGEVIHTEGSWEKPEKKYCSECGIKMEFETNEEKFSR